MSSGSTAVTIKVPLWPTLGEAIRQVSGNLKAIGQGGWLPFVVLTLFAIVTQLLYANSLVRAVPAGATGAAVLQAMLLGLIALAVQTFCYNAFMVSWYRHILWPVDHSGLASGYWRAFWRSMGCALTLLGFIVLMTVILFLGIASSGEVVAGTLLFLIAFTRVALVFPAAASGNALGFRMGWRKMRGNTWRLIAAFALVTVVCFGIELVLTLAMNGTAIHLILSGAAPQITPQPVMLVFTVQLVGRFVLFLFLALISSIAAIFYRELVLRPGGVAEVLA